MGKGDQRSRRGKIHRGTFGKKRPRKSKLTKAVTAPTEPLKKSKKEAAAGES
jgi:ribosomal small subunit protein bTHX